MNQNGSPKNNATNTKGKQDQKNKKDQDNGSSRLQGASLVKYDTKFLVSTTLSNKKLIEQLESNDDNAENFLRNLINKRSIDVNINIYSI
jgi:hypothetical protein